MIPGAVAALSESSGASGPPPFEGPMVYAAAAGMGLTLGVILGLPQWLQLRAYARRSLRWVGANAVAWAAGMVIIFAGAGSTPANAPVGLVIAVIAAACLCAGLVVGAIHGLILIRILKPATETMSSKSRRKLSENVRCLASMTTARQSVFCSVHTEETSRRGAERVIFRE